MQFQYADTSAGEPLLMAEAAGLTSASQHETVVADSASQLAFVTLPQTLIAGARSDTMTVELEDAFGNPSDAVSPMTVDLSTTSGQGAFSPSSSLTIAAGTSSISFHYADTLAGMPTLFAAIAGLSTASQQETVIAAVGSHLEFINAEQILTAGAPRRR